MPAIAYHRRAREYPYPLPTAAIQIDPPPQVQTGQGIRSQLLQLLYPLSGVLISGIFILTTYQHQPSGNNTLLIIAEVGIMPLSVGLMVLVNVLQRRSAKQRQRTEYATYRRELADCQRLLDDVQQKQRQWNSRLYPRLSDLQTVIEKRQNLWERRPTNDDFLDVRIGLAPVQLCCPIDFKEDRKATYVPELLQEVRDLVMRNNHVDKQPIVISLRNVGTLALTGPRSATRAVVRAMLCHIIAFQAPNEVRIIVSVPKEAVSEWSWLKWLPHTRLLRRIKSEAKHSPQLFSLIADNAQDMQELIITQIKPEIERRGKLNQNARGSARDTMLPHLVVVLDGFNPLHTLAQVPELEGLLRNPARLGLTILCLVDEQEQEPAAVGARLTPSVVAGNTQLTYQETALGGKTIEFILSDKADPQTCEQMARGLTPLTLSDPEAPFDFAQDVRLLELLDIPSLETLQVTEKWHALSPQQLLRVPIGRQKHGPLTIDLKQLAEGGYGPHGMLIGATGSGKSELLRTLVTSLALTHDPQMLNFVLIDFKAGAAFADFKDLPHVTGIVTNLEDDPLLIDRISKSLWGEFDRRQSVLSKTGGNIQEYHKRWRKDPTMKPMPYLLVIVDEFAQLITSYEDFMKLFTKLGGVGRSLGIHMLLATQRISDARLGTLDGHLRYRIALRTFTPEESIAAIGTPDAYYLPPFPGSGYFKVGEDLYTPFKTALITTPYEPIMQQVDPLSLMQTCTATGKLVPCQPQKDSSSTSTDEEMPTEMAMVIERIEQVPVPTDGWHLRSVWRPPLETRIPLVAVFNRCNQLLKRSGYEELDGSHWETPEPFGVLCTPIGMVDDPDNQMQGPLLLDFSGTGGHLAIVGVPQAGKSTLLATLLASLLITHSPQAVQCYCIDLGGGLLRVFEGAPHVGAVCGRAERDKTLRVLRLVRQIIVEREQLFAEQRLDIGTYRQLRQKGELSAQRFGDVFLLIDNFGQLQSDYETSNPEVISDILSIAATGLTYGVHLIITANQWIEVRPSRLRSNINARLELRLSDPSESDIDRKQAAKISPTVPGRGLHQSKLLFQTAWPVIHDTIATNSLQQAVTPLVQRMRSAWQGRTAPQILVLPQRVTWEMIAHLDRGRSTGVPLGLDELHLDPQVPICIDLFKGDPHFLILGDRECGKTTLLRTWIHALKQNYGPEQIRFVLIDYRKTLLDIAATKSDYQLTYAFTPDKVHACVEELKIEFERRMEERMSLSIEQLRNSQGGNEPHYIVFVDDYEMVATPDPRTSPLKPLESALLSAQEIGFHLVLTRRITNWGQTMLDPIFRGIKNMESPGLVMRGDLVEGRDTLHKVRASDMLPNGRGYLARRGYPTTLIQVAYSDSLLSI